MRRFAISLFALLVGCTEGVIGSVGDLDATLSDVHASAELDAGTPSDAMPADASDASMQAPYSPCPLAAPCVILALGDSITAGLGSSNGAGYRGPLFAHANAEGHSIAFVGSQQGGPVEAGRTPSVVDGRLALPRLARSLRAPRACDVVLC